MLSETGNVVTPVNQNVQSGSNATLTSLVDTTNKSAYPTGTVTLLSNSINGPVSGPNPCTSVKDGSGNYACQATFTFAPAASITVYAQYSGDNNYPLSPPHPPPFQFPISQSGRARASSPSQPVSL